MNRLLFIESVYEKRKTRLFQAAAGKAETMITPEEMNRMLGENPQQQDMLNYIFTEIAKAAKADFPAYLKMVQMDVTKAVLDGVKKDNMVDAKLLEMTAAVDQVMKQIGTDIEKHIQDQYDKEKADPNGYIPA